MKQEILIWKTFDQTVFHKLNQSTTVKEKRNILSDALRLNERDWKNGKEKTEILLDAFTQCYNFAQQHEFSVQSSSGNFIFIILSSSFIGVKVLLAILNQVHEFSCQTSFENTMSSAKFAQELILSHSVLRPPFSIEVFSPKEAELAYQYMTDNYFRWVNQQSGNSS